MRKRGPSLRATIRSIEPSRIARAIRPHYRKWTADDGKPGRPPHDPVGMVRAMLLEGWSRPDFTAFLRKHPEWLRILRFEKAPDDSCWSKLLARMPADALQDLVAELVHQLRREGLVTFRVAVADSSFLPVCDWDRDAA